MPALKAYAFPQTNASVLLDLVRGLAAMIVLLEHWRYIFFVDYPQIAYHRSLFGPFYIACAAGHQAVVIFFVLSGYLISGSVFRMLERGTWSWRLYFTHRLLRLWIVLIPGLLLCALWDGIGLHLGMAPLLYHGLSGNHVVRDVAGSHTAHTFASNLFFLQEVRATTFGSDAPLWSLANEFWYYVLFPLGLFAVRPRTPLRTRALCFLCFAAVAWFIGLNILVSFPIWLLGTGLALVPAPRVRQGIRLFAGAVYLPVFFAAGGRLPIPAIVSDYILALLTLLLLWLVLSASSPFRPSPGVRFSRGLAKFSYTLYVAHMPVCVLLAAVLAGDSRWQPTPFKMTMGLGILGLLLGYAFVLAQFTEFRTDGVRRWIERRFFSPHRVTQGTGSRPA